MSKRTKKKQRQNSVTNSAHSPNLNPGSIMKQESSESNLPCLNETSLSERTVNYPKLTHNYASGETEESISLRQDVIKTAAEHLSNYLDENESLSYIDFYNTFKLTEQHLTGIKNILILTSPSERRWLIVQYDNNTLPILSIIRSPTKPTFEKNGVAYEGPSLPENWDRDKKYQEKFYAKVREDIPKGICPTVSLLEVPDDRPVKLPPKPKKPDCIELQIVNYIQYKCNGTATLQHIVSTFTGWDCSIILLNKRMKMYGIKLIELPGFILTVSVTGTA